MVSTGLALYWRCGACDVADWRRRNQSRDSGCRGGGEYSCRTFDARNGFHDRSSARATQARIPHAHDPGIAGVLTKQCDQPRPRQSSVSFAVADEAFQSLAILTKNSGAISWGWIPRGTRENEVE